MKLVFRIILFGAVIAIAFSAGNFIMQRMASRPSTNAFVATYADDDVDTATVELATTLAQGATSALGEAKRVVYNGIDATLETAGEFEAAMITKAMASADGLEGVAAFVEKRAPEFD